MTTEQTSAQAHNISVLPSGRAFSSQGEETILAAAIRSGVGLPYGSRTVPVAPANARS